MRRRSGECARRSARQAAHLGRLGHPSRWPPPGRFPLRGRLTLRLLLQTWSARCPQPPPAAAPRSCPVSVAQPDGLCLPFQTSWGDVHGERGRGPRRLRRRGPEGSAWCAGPATPRGRSRAGCPRRLPGAAAGGRRAPLPGTATGVGAGTNAGRPSDGTFTPGRVTRTTNLMQSEGAGPVIPDEFPNRSDDNSLRPGRGRNTSDSQSGCARQDPHRSPRPWAEHVEIRTAPHEGKSPAFLTFRFFFSLGFGKWQNLRSHVGPDSRLRKAVRNPDSPKTAARLSVVVVLCRCPGRCLGRDP